MRPPPRIVRRLVLAPLALGWSLIAIAVSPVCLLGAAVVDLVVSRRRLQTLRLVSFAVVYLVFEVAGLTALFGLWVASGFGAGIRTPRVQDRHYALMRWWLYGLNAAARTLFHFKIWIEDRPEPRAGPILVFSRHAGPGNSLMLVGTLIVGYRRRPRIVLLDSLQWEPLFDTLLNRLPNRFIERGSANPRRYLNAIRDLAAGVGDRDALVLFPEGHDFTPRLRRRIIERLRRQKKRDDAERAEHLAKVLLPKYGGVMAAIDGAPHADVVLVAHTVLEDLGTFAEVWRQIPLDRPIHSHYWRLSAAEVPKEPEVLATWLFDWWARIDRWIAERSSASVR